MRRRGFLKLVLPPGPIADAEGLAVRLAGLFGHDLADQPPVVGRQLRAMREADLTARLGDLAGLPTLILGGPHDQIAPRRAGRALHKGIPGSRYLEVRDASHGLPITHANLVNSLLVEHLVGACRTGEKT
jgi:pimeloyl-ACP methyl ester carboxylesterase